MNIVLNEKKTENSGDLYVKLLNEKPVIFGKAKPEDLEPIVRTLAGELYYDFHSDFLDACYTSWEDYCKHIKISDLMYTPRSFSLSRTDAPYKISTLNAFCFFSCLAMLVNGEDISETVDKWGKSFYKKHDYPHPSDLCVDKLIEKIDHALIAMHQNALRENKKYKKDLAKLFEDPNIEEVLKQAEAEAEKIREAARKDADKINAELEEAKKLNNRLREETERSVQNIRTDAEKDAEVIRAQANEKLKKAQEEAQRIVDAANQEAAKKHQAAQEEAAQKIKVAEAKADQTIKDAEEKASRKKAKAETDANEIRQKPLMGNYLAEYRGLQEGFNKVREALNEVESCMKLSDDLFTNMQMMRFFDIYSDLYTLIHQGKASFPKLSEEYSYLQENLDAYLDIITEGLGEVGVGIYISEPGSPYDGERHDVQNSKQYDPRTATVQESVLPGFVCFQNDKVLRKERVNI